jgi:DNA gyrase subunit A
LAVSQVRLAGRATQGVRLINLRNGDSIAAVAKVDADDEESIEIIDQNIVDETINNEEDMSDK